METPIRKLIYPNTKGNSLYIKREDLLPFSLGGNKVRIAKEYMNHMKRQGCDCMIIYGNSRSNLCRVLANLCYQQKIPCYMICSSQDGEDARMQTNNSRLMKWLDAKVIPCQQSRIAQTVEETMKELQAFGFHPYYIYGDKFGCGNEAAPVQAYVDAYLEIMDYEKLNQTYFDYIFLPSGTGATQSGLICGHLLAGDDRKIVGISISSREHTRGVGVIETAVSSYLREKYPEISWSPKKEIQLEEDYKLGGYGQYDARILRCIQEEFAENGIPLDPTYTGKAFWGMKQYIKKQGIQDSRILFLHTGGTPLFYDSLVLEEEREC